MNNILFFLTPKAMCVYLYDDFTIRQALEKMESAGYAALPILNKRGEYRGTLTEGDLMWAIKNMCYLDMRQAEARKIMEITRRKDNIPVRVNTNMHDLVQRSNTQNFVPVVDDGKHFIGIITRKDLIQYLCKKLVKAQLLAGLLTGLGTDGRSGKAGTTCYETHFGFHSISFLSCLPLNL